MTIQELADDACINCGQNRDGRVIEPWGLICTRCDDSMAEYHAVKIPVPDFEPARVCWNTLR